MTGKENIPVSMIHAFFRLMARLTIIQISVANTSVEDGGQKKGQGKEANLHEEMQSQFRYREARAYKADPIPEQPSCSYFHEFHVFVGMDPGEVLEDEALPNLQDAEESDIDFDDDDDEGVDENGRHPDESDDEDDPINDIYLDGEDFFEAYVFEGTGADGRPIPIRRPHLDQITTQQGNDTSNSSRRGPNVSPPPGAPETQAPRPGKEREAPTLVLAKQALEDLQKLLRPPRDKGYGYKDPGLDP